MSYRRPQFVNDEIYHIVMRGVADSLIFKDRNDYFRAIFSIYEFNTSQPVEIKEKRMQRRQNLIRAVGGRTSDSSTRRKGPKEPLVEVLAFCFMPNHVHLLLKQIKDGGVSKFMQKFGTGYASYFNKKYERMGHLFQGRFRAVHIKDDEQLKNVFVYIHTNPISLIEPNWKEIGIADPEKANRFLEKHKWSSYPDYIGKKNFPSLTERNFILKIFDGSENCKDFVEGWIKYKGEIKDFDDVGSE